MKLKFEKTEGGDIAAYILDDKDQLDFSYVRMIGALLEGQPLECEFSDDMTPEEREQIENLNTAIFNKIHTDENGNPRLF